MHPGGTGSEATEYVRVVSIAHARPTRPRRRRSRWSEPVAGLAAAPTAVFAVGLLLWARGVRARLIAEDGLYISQDANWYFERAEAFAQGDWFWHGVTSGRATHYPPGYPLVLRIVDAIPGIELHTGVLLVNVACVVALSIALARIVVHLTSPSGGSSGGSPRDPSGSCSGRPSSGMSGGLIADRWERGSTRQLLLSAVAISFVCGPRVIDYTAAPLTEPIFYAAWAWSIVILLEHRHRRPAGLAALMGLGLVAVGHRYIAASLVAGITLWIFLADGRGRTAARRAGTYLAAVAIPLLIWSALVGGIAQERAPGELGLLDAFRDSLLMFGSVLLHLQTGRIGGVSGPAYTLGPAGADTFAARLAVIVSIVVIILAAIGLHRTTRNFRRLPTSEPVLLLAVTTAAYVLQPLAFRLRIRHIFLDRYWGLAPTFLLLIAAVGITSVRTTAPSAPSSTDPHDPMGISDPSPPSASPPSPPSSIVRHDSLGASVPADPHTGSPASRRTTFDRVARIIVWAIVGFAIVWSTHRYGADLPAIRDTIKRP